MLQQMTASADALVAAIRAATRAIDQTAAGDVSAALTELDHAAAACNDRMAAAADHARAVVLWLASQSAATAAQLGLDLFAPAEVSAQTSAPVSAPETPDEAADEWNAKQAAVADAWNAAKPADAPEPYEPLAADCEPLSVPQMAAAADRMAQAVTAAANGPAEEQQFDQAWRDLPDCVGADPLAMKTLDDLRSACRVQLDLIEERQDGAESDDPKALRRWLKKYPDADQKPARKRRR